MKSERPKCKVCGADLLKLRRRHWVCANAMCDSPIVEPLMWCDDERFAPDIVPRKIADKDREVPT